MRIKEALSEASRVLVVDEAQWLDTRAFEFIRELWDDDDTRLAVVLVGAENCYQKIKNRPALDSRILVWQRYKPLTPTEVLTVIPSTTRCGPTSSPTTCCGSTTSPATATSANGPRSPTCSTKPTATRLPPAAPPHPPGRTDPMPARPPRPRQTPPPTVAILCAPSSAGSTPPSGTPNEAGAVLSV
ncbi:AAA family ATPase [Streptomyces sp. NPDC002156]